MNLRSLNWSSALWSLVAAPLCLRRALYQAETEDWLIRRRATLISHVTQYSPDELHARLRSVVRRLQTETPWSFEYALERGVDVLEHEIEMADALNCGLWGGADGSDVGR